jgi:hypothetical protein
MITNAFLYAIYGIVYALTSPIRLLDNVSINTDLVDNIAMAQTYLESVSVFIPVSVILIILGFEIGLEIGIFSYKFIMWGIKRLPTQS